MWEDGVNPNPREIFVGSGVGVNTVRGHCIIYIYIEYIHICIYVIIHIHIFNFIPCENWSREIFVRSGVGVNTARKRSIIYKYIDNIHRYIYIREYAYTCISLPLVGVLIAEDMCSIQRWRRLDRVNPINTYLYIYLYI